VGTGVCSRPKKNLWSWTTRAKKLTSGFSHYDQKNTIDMSSMDQNYFSQNEYYVPQRQPLNSMRNLHANSNQSQQSLLLNQGHGEQSIQQPYEANFFNY
jgi:hypothetical protein